MNNSTSTNNQEIDLLKVLITSIKKLFTFLSKNLFTFILLTIIGVVIGYFVSPLFKKYESRIILSPNFDTTEYLYNEIDFVNSKIIEQDTVFLNSVGLDKKVTHISVEPIISVYQFVQKNEKNFDLIKLFAEDGDINKVAEDEKTAKNYSNHQIIISSKKANIDSKNIDKLFHYLNRSNYFNQLKDVTNKNLEDRILVNNTTIKQIDDILNKFSKESENQKSSNLVYFNDNTQLNEILSTKSSLVKENEIIIERRLAADKAIKKVAQSLNIQEKSKTKLLMLIIPVLLIITFYTTKSLILSK